MVLQSLRERVSEKAEQLGKLEKAGISLLLSSTGICLAYSAGRAVRAHLRLRKKLKHIKWADGRKPIVGHTLTMARAVWAYPCTWDLLCTWAAQHAPEPSRVQIFARQCVATCEPDDLRTIFTSERSSYQKDVAFAYEPFLDVLGTGLVTAEGDLWWTQRKRVAHAFRVEILDFIVPIALRASERLKVKLRQAAGSGESVDMNEEFRHLTLQVIGEAILSLTPEEADRVFPHLYLPVMEEANKRSLSPWRKYLPLPASLRYRHKLKQLNQYVIQIIRNRIYSHESNGPPSNDKMDILDRVINAIPYEERHLQQTETQLCYEVKTFVLAGHETSASMLTWTLFELTRNPEHMDRVRVEGREAAQRCSTSSTMPTPKWPTDKPAVEQLDFTLAALKESLRKYSIVPVVTRNLVKDSQLGGKYVPAGSMVICGLQAVHHREDIWHKPNEYNPTRFCDGNDKHIDQYHFVPFIQGPRNCLGQHLALLEARAVLQSLVQEFDFESNHSAGDRHVQNIPIAPAGGMPMRVRLHSD